MRAGQSDLYKGTWGDNADNIPDELKEKIKLPENDAQIKHIFRKDKGHLEDTPENRQFRWDEMTGLNKNITDEFRRKRK